MQHENFSDNEQRLDHLFAEYRDACVVPEPSAGFMPVLWQKIEARQSSSWFFRQVSGWLVAASAAATAVLALALLLNPVQGNPIYAETYVDALAADHASEYSLYTEPVHAERVTDFSAGGILE